MKDWSEKEDQMKNEEEKTNINNVSNKFIYEEDNQIKVEKIDGLLREKISKYEINPELKSKEIKELLSYADLNFINLKDKNSNLSMIFCEKGEPKLINLLLDGNFDNKEKQTEIDLFKVNINNENILHYLFKNELNYEIDKIFEKIMIYINGDKKNKNRKELLKKEDKNGITPLVLILRKGWYNILKLYLHYFKYKPHIIKSDKNNNIHCAIEGKEIKCLELILSHCSIEELNQQNSSGFIPSAYAKEKKYFYMYELIKQFQSNFNDKEFINLIVFPENNTYKIIERYMNKDFLTVQNLLLKYKMNHQIINNNNINNKYSNISFEWNTLLNKRMEFFNKGLEKEHIITQFKENYKNKNNNSYPNKLYVIATLYEFNKFFNKYINEIDIKDHIDEEGYCIDIVIYNKIIYYYKICDYDSFLKYINLYLTNIYPQCKSYFINKSIILEDSKSNDNNYNKIRINYYKYITFVNISFLLIEYFIKDNNEQFSQIIMDKLGNYFTENGPLQITNDKIKENNESNNNTIAYDFDNDYYKLNLNNKTNIINYLNNKEILNPLNPTLDDSLCYLYLLEVFFNIKFKSSKSETIRRINKLSTFKFINYKSEEENEEKDEEDEEEENEIEENNIYDDVHLDTNKNNIKILNNTRQILKKVKIIMKNSNLLTNFTNRFKLFYYELKSYLYYLSGDVKKSMSKIFKIKKKLDSGFNSNEHKMLYYNSQGILNLKLKKYTLAEHFFKLGINLFKIIHLNINTQRSIENNDIIIYKSEYLFKMKFNLGLAYFYNNNYLESFNVFNELKNKKEIKNNIFFWFRFGLTSLNLYLFSMRKLKQKYRKYYQDLVIKKKDIEEEVDLSEDNYSIESSSIYELYEEYEKLYGNKEIVYNYDDKKNKTNKIFINYKIPKVNDYENNNINNYLDISINSFKKVLSIYKKINYLNLYNNKKVEDLKFIYNFYTKNIGETKEFRNMINKQNINKKNNIPKSLIYTSYLNLLFAYNQKKKYFNMLLLIKNIKKEKSLSNNIKRKIRYYELLALINLNKTKKGEELINEEMNKYGNIDNDANNDFDCFNIDDCQIVKDINHKILLQIGQVFIDCKNKKYEEAENKLLKVVEKNYNNNEDISRYYYQLMIYILSSQNKKSKTIKLIKYRWKQIQNTYTHYYKDNNG